MPVVNEAMDTLTAQWYNAMVAGLNLSKEQFQIYQGSNTLVGTDQGVWNIISSIPPEAINNYFDPAQFNAFNAQYNNILTSLNATPDTAFETCMGAADYAIWKAYLKSNPPTSTDATYLSKYFKDWAVLNAPSKARCGSLWVQTMVNPVNIALDMFASAQFATPPKLQGFPWNQTRESLLGALKGGSTRRYVMNSRTQSSKIENSWANSSKNVFFGLFDYSDKYSKLSTETINAGIDIEVTFGKMTTFALGPYAQNDYDDKVLSKYNPWYYSAALATAYTDKSTWQDPSKWDLAFGKGGFLVRMATALIAADEVTIKITSFKTFTKDEQTIIQNQSSEGFWPFYNKRSDTGSDTKVHFYDDGRMEVTSTTPKDSPQILGILQTPISNIF